MKKLSLPFKQFIFLGLILIINSLFINLFANKSSYNIDVQLNEVENHTSMEENKALIESRWTGKTSSEWNAAENWSNELVPDTFTNITISSGENQPEINSSAFCNNITIDPSASLIIHGTNSLTVKGNWTNNGSFTAGLSSVVFSGEQQVIKGITTFTNVIIGGSGQKTISTADFIVSGSISMEKSGTISASPYYKPNAKIVYNTAITRNTGYEWPLYIFAGEIIIKNTGIIKLGATKYSDLYSESCILTIHEGSTFNLQTFYLNKVRALNLKCGGKINGSTISGTGTMKLIGDIFVTDAGNGTSGAIVSCQVKLLNNSVVTVENDENSNDDLTINFLTTQYSLTKEGAGTLNLGICESKFSNLYINEGKLIIPAGGQLELTNKAYVDVIEGLIIESNETGTGSLITTGTESLGSIKVERAMSPGAWHLVSSPVGAMSIGSFLSANSSVPSDQYGYKAIRDYNPALNQWNEFFTSTTPGNLLTGTGYCMRVRESMEHKVIFTGTLRAGVQTITGLQADKWNCIGNPYTSAIGINVESNSYLDFLTHNAGGVSPTLDPAYGIYFWDRADSYNGQSSCYTAVSNATPGYLAQQGQAFMVKMAPAKTSVTFNKSMQLHRPGLSLKSTLGTGPVIRLTATVDSVKSSTLVAFREEMTNGLDPTYDAGLFKSGDEMVVYTRLVEDYGIPFAIQALPADRYENTIVPVGIDCPMGGTVSFSAQLQNLPSDCPVILEDRQKNTFTDLSRSTYRVDLPVHASIQGRFFLHTSFATTGTNHQTDTRQLKAWVVGGNWLQIQGDISNKARISIYNLQGRRIMDYTGQDLDHERLLLPALRPGIYLLQIYDPSLLQVCKLKIDG